MTPTVGNERALGARAYAVRDAILARRMSDPARRAAVATLAGIVADARRADDYELALRRIVEYPANSQSGLEAAIQELRNIAEDALAGKLPPR